MKSLDGVKLNKRTQTETYNFVSSVWHFNVAACPEMKDNRIIQIYTSPMAPCTSSASWLQKKHLGWGNSWYTVYTFFQNSDLKPEVHYFHGIRGWTREENADKGRGGKKQARMERACGKVGENEMQGERELKKRGGVQRKIRICLKFPLRPVGEEPSPSEALK